MFARGCEHKIAEQDKAIIDSKKKFFAYAA